MCSESCFVVQDEVYGEWSLNVMLGCWKGTSYLFHGESVCDPDPKSACDPYFAFCLQPSSVNPSSEYCPWGSYVTSQSLNDMDDFCFQGFAQQLSIANPLVFNVSGSYPVRSQVAVILWIICLQIIHRHISSNSIPCKWKPSTSAFAQPLPKKNIYLCIFSFHCI